MLIRHHHSSAISALKSDGSVYNSDCCAECVIQRINWTAQTLGVNGFSLSAYGYHVDSPETSKIFIATQQHPSDDRQSTK